MNLNKIKNLFVQACFLYQNARESKEIANTPLRMRIKLCSCALFTGIRQGRSRRECTHFSLCLCAIHPARVKRDCTYVCECDELARRLSPDAG